MQICLAFILKCEFKYSTLKTAGIYLHAISQHLKIRTKSQCVYVHVCVCMCVKGHTIPQLLLWHLHPFSAHTNFTSQSAHAQLLPDSDPPLRPSPTWDQLPPWNTQTRQTEGTRGGAGRGNTKLITGKWVCLFAWHAFVSVLSTPRASRRVSIYPARTERPDWRRVRTSTEARYRLPIIF